MSFEIGTASDAADLFDRLNTFLTSKGKAFMPSFTGVGNGLISAWEGGASSVLETFEITATSPTAFSVVGSVSGNIGTATVGTPFAHSKLNFTLTAGTTPFAVGDKFKVNTCEPWISLRNLGGVKHYSNFANYRRVYDGDSASFANVHSLHWPGIIGLQLNRAIEVKALQLTNYTTGTAYPKDFSLEYSDDGVTWTTAQSWASVPWIQQRLAQVFPVTSSPGAHAHWRLKVTANYGHDLVDLAEVYFCTDPSGSNASRISWEWELAWKTKGNDGLREIIVGAQYFWSAVSDFYNWRVNGYTGWNDGVYSDQQPGGLTPWIQPMLFLWKNPMPYWFVANGQRVMVFVRVGTIYMSIYLGLIDAFISPGQYPYPLFIGANYATTARLGADDTNYRYDNVNANMSTWIKGHYNNSNDQTYSCGRLREPGGQYIGLRTYGNQTSVNNVYMTTPWPYNAQGSSMAIMRPNLDGSFPLIKPILSVDMTATGTAVGFLGEFDGAYATIGFTNAAENTFKEGLFTYVVWKDTFRAGTNDFLAFKLD